jgi:membrane protease YdiL (CAAX protease family)
MQSENVNRFPASPIMTPRLHPFVRLLLCAISLAIVSVMLGLTLWTGNYISTVFTDAPPKETFEQMVVRYQLVITLLTYPACLLVINGFRTKLDCASFASLGLRPIKTTQNLLRGALAGTLAIAILWSILWLTGAINVEGWSAPFFENPIGAILPLSGYFLTFCAVAFFEEVLFRGYILHNLNSWLGWRLAVAGQAFLFALIHLGNVVEADQQGKISALWSLPALFLIAIFFAISYRKTGSLWFAIGFHALWNFSLGCLFSLPVSGIETYRILDVTQATNTLLSGGSFGAEGSLYLPVLLLAMIHFLRGAPNHPQAELDLALLTRTRSDTISTNAEKPLPSMVQTSPLSLKPPIREHEEDEGVEERSAPNRFNTRFGSQEGFDSQTLQELRELQRNREEAKAAELNIKKAEVELQNHKPLVELIEQPMAPFEVTEAAITQPDKQPQPQLKEVEALQNTEVAPLPVVKQQEETDNSVIAPQPVTPQPVTPQPVTPQSTPTKKPSLRW